MLEFEYVGWEQKLTILFLSFEIFTIEAAEFYRCDDASCVTFLGSMRETEHQIH
jgi:hypothetical protein